MSDRYEDKKREGRIRLRKGDGREVCISENRYDPITGAAVAPKERTVALSTLEAEGAQLQDRLDDLNALLVDLNAL